jgi:hypothetical protein
MLLDDYAELKITPPSSEPMRVTILEKMVKIFEQRMRQKMPGSMVQFRKLARFRDEIRDILLDVLSPSVHRRARDSSELAITYAAKFERTIYIFTGELDKRWQGAVLAERTFKEESGDVLAATLKTIFTDVTRAAINELERAGIWTDYDISLKEFFLEKKQIVA